jgi:hypothetical protein
MPRKPKIEDAAVTHKKCVYADAEFVAEAKAIAAHLGITADKSVLPIEFDGKLYYYVGKDATTIAIDADVARFNLLAAEYSITTADVISFLNGSQKSPIHEYVKPRVEVSYSFPDRIKIMVPPDATKQEIIRQLGKVKTLQQLFFEPQKTKHKPPENYQLIYAIFRARAKAQTFDAIYRQYEDGSLPMYNQAATHKSVESLSRYYRKYQPQRDS